MARFSRIQVWQTMERTGLVPLYYHGNPAVAAKIAEALAKGGARVIEFTNRGDRAFEVFREVLLHMEEVAPDCIIGIGTVLDAPTAGLYINLGADFVVSPVISESIARLCNQRKIAYIPGCCTPTEIASAEELGVEICKIFPGAQAGGADFIRMIKGPCPWSSLMPTGGIDATREDLKEWFEAGVSCVGIGRRLVRPELVEKHNWNELAAVTSQCLAWITEVRGGDGTRETLT